MHDCPPDVTRPPIEAMLPATSRSTPVGQVTFLWIDRHATPRLVITAADMP